jgi:hypothetical protein
LNSSIAALTRDASAAASTLSPQAAQKSPRPAGIVVVSPLYVYGTSRVSRTRLPLPQDGHFIAFLLS